MGVLAADADDVVQEVFVVATKKLGSFDGRVALGTWLLGIALRLSRQHRRRNWRLRLSRLVGLETQLPAPVDPERALAAQEEIAEAHWILARMSERRRVVFVLYEVEGLEGPEIAALLGCSVNTVKSRLYSARTEFRRLSQKALREFEP